MLEQVEDIVLDCTVKGFPAPTITWNRGDTELTGAEDRITITNAAVSMDNDGFYVVESTLMISPSNRDDSDMYSCVATNTVLGSTRTDTRIFNLTVNCMCFTHTFLLFLHSTNLPLSSGAQFL